MTNKDRIINLNHFIMQITLKKTYIFKILISAILMFSIIGCLSEEEITKEKITKAEKFIGEEQYEEAVLTLNEINKESPLYTQVEQLKYTADSLHKIKLIADSIAVEEALIKLEEDKKQKQIEQLEREIKSINKGVKFSGYRGTVEALQLELVLFGTWANIINEAKNSDDNKIKKLASQLKAKVVRLQRKEFPILRKKYTKVVANKLWQNDIHVYSNGTGHTIINFAGGLFASNKNKQDFQNEIREILKMFRFKQARYRWYKGADEYTYWKIEPNKDTELVTFDK